MSTPKPFQQATIDVAVKALKDRRRKARHFLVADEVGLGKTVVAQQVLKRLMDEKDGPGPLTVFYVCSNLSIATQNRQKLLEVLPEDERADAQCLVDRLTLMPTAKAPTHPKLRLFTLTPDTSLPVRQQRRRDGRKEERALLQALVEATFPELPDAMGWDAGFFRRHATKHWDELVERKRQQVADSRLREPFRLAVREAFGLQEGERIQPRLRSITDELAVIATLRTALAMLALQHLAPDLVIFDEFQRFRDLIDEEQDESASRIVSVLRGDRGGALLMLSATPYSLLTPREHDGAKTSHHAQMLDLVDFLYGRGELGRSKQAVCREAFAILEQAFRRGNAQDERAQQAIGQLEDVLRPVMARTERAMHPLGRDDTASTTLREAPLHPADLQAFHHFSASLHKLDVAAAPAYWSSIPMPLQTMGSRYKAWERATPQPDARSPIFRQAERDEYKLATPWPHPKLRALAGLAGPALLSLPWVAPSQPWWKLQGPWKHQDAQRGKVLVFSRFRAVPAAISAALSYDLERSFMRNKNLAYADVPRRRMLQATGERMPLLAAFHPCPLLADMVDPLQHGALSLKALRSALRRQLLDGLQDMGIRLERHKGKPRPVWRLLAGLEQRAGVFEQTLLAWEALQDRIGHPAANESEQEGGSDAGLSKLIQAWRGAGTPLAAVSEAELESLVQHALGAPGVVLARALRRHWPQALDAEQLPVLLTASWTGLRTYLDQRWFAAALGHSARNYLGALVQATVDGNLESVLDEWFWLLGNLHGRRGADLCDEIVAVARLRGSDIRLHTPGSEGQSFTVRAHAALPFIEARQAQAGDEAEARPLRNDELRKAFNSPFYPHVLSTTSVGQEGLDFHAWCRTVVHWDLAPNAADLEQREGRIQRYAGLSVRREIARRVRMEPAELGKDQASPWTNLAGAADRQLGDGSGLAPWWVCEGAHIERLILDVPTSEQRSRLEALRIQRGLYRLVLGQPYQEDLMAAMKQRGWDGGSTPSDLVPVLSPFFHRMTEHLPQVEKLILDEQGTVRRSNPESSSHLQAGSDIEQEVQRA